MQQVVGPNGEIQNVPIQLSASQLQMLRMQLQSNAQQTNQQIILQTSPLQSSTSAQQGSQQQIILQTSPIQQPAAMVSSGGQNTSQIIQS